MTHEEIKAAIERLEALRFDGDSHENLSAICRALYKPELGWAHGACKILRDNLVDLLMQADPDTHMVLPVDADGMPIHVGDKLDFSKAESNLVVIGVGLSHPAEDSYGVYVRTSDGELTWYNAEYLHHHHKPTVEDVLREFAERVIDSQIPALSHTYEETIAEYASRLALKDEAMATSEGLES